MNKIPFSFKMGLISEKGDKIETQVRLLISFYTTYLIWISISNGNQPLFNYLALMNCSRIGFQFGQMQQILVKIHFKRKLNIFNYES